VLQLDLPRLGKVHAVIRMEGEQAQLQMRVQDEQAASALKAQTAVLSEAMAASGTALSGMTVQRDELA
jgi:flagellar hook-length control protein FliK